MAALHGALKTLGKVDYSTLASNEDLAEFLTSTFEDAQTIIHSISSPDESSTTGTAATAAPPWEPVKINAEPEGISVFKTAGDDEQGTWYARKSIHTGLGFSRFKRALETEFSQSLAAGASSIRGIDVEERVDQMPVAVGKLEVYRFSKTLNWILGSREFVELCLRADRPLEGVRQFMMVSKPCSHAQVPEKKKPARAQYESLEFIRERKDLSDSSSVEWIMITRSNMRISGVPTSMIEDGTPPAILEDAGKFLTWARTVDIDDLEEDESEDDLQNDGSEDVRPTTADSCESFKSAAESLNTTPSETTFGTGVMSIKERSSDTPSGLSSTGGIASTRHRSVSAITATSSIKSTTSTNITTKLEKEQQKHEEKKRKLEEANRKAKEKLLSKSNEDAEKLIAAADEKHAKEMEKAQERFQSKASKLAKQDEKISRKRAESLLKPISKLDLQSQINELKTVNDKLQQENQSLLLQNTHMTRSIRTLEGGDEMLDRALQAAADDLQAVGVDGGSREK